MATVTRQCCNCVWFQEGSRLFDGRCLHPARQLPYDPQPWVRERELACREGWDFDLWEPSNRNDDRLIDIRIIGPDGPGPMPPRQNLLQRLLVLPESTIPTDPYDVLIEEEIARE